MATVLKRETFPQFSIVNERTVLTYTHPTTSETIIVIPRVELGNPCKIAGGGNYTVTAKIDGQTIAPPSVVNIPLGPTSAMFQSREIVVEPGDVVTITVLGLATDLAVSSVAVLLDATPASEDDINMLADRIGVGVAGTPVDHDFGGTDNLTYETIETQGVADATILVYLKSDYDVGNRAGDFVLGTTTTDINGRWRRQIMLETGTYTLLFFKKGAFGPDLKTIVV